MQVSYRLFELTNTLKVAFVPSKDDKRLAYNIIAAVVILSVLYTLSFVFLKLPQMLVSVLPRYIVLFFISFLVIPSHPSISGVAVIGQKYICYKAC